MKTRSLLYVATVAAACICLCWGAVVQADPATKAPPAKLINNSSAVPTVSAPVEGGHSSAATPQQNEKPNPKKDVVSFLRARVQPSQPSHGQPGNPRFPTDTAFGENALSKNAETIILNNPSVATIIGADGLADFLSGGAFGPEGTYQFTYAMNIGPAGGGGAITLYTQSTATGALTTIGVVTGLGANQAPCGMSWDWTSNTMYMEAIDTSTGLSYLYTVNLTTAAVSLVGQISSGFIIDMAINCEGTIYAFDIGADIVGTIDKTNGTFTPLPNGVGFSANYAQGMDFDRSDGTLYLFAYNTAAGGELRTVDLTTGLTTLIGALGASEEWGYGAIETICCDVPGACCDPMTGVCQDNFTLVDCSAIGGQFHCGLACTQLPLACGNPGACCDDYSGDCQDGVLELVCLNQGGRPSPGVLCANVDPPCAQGACCDPYTGDCVVDFAYACTGIFKGAGTSCEPINPCMGACCNFDQQGNCAQMSELACSSVNGFYLGDNSDCSACPCIITPPPGAQFELEPCGADSNGGCNMATPAFEPITAGVPVFGTAYSTTSIRDTDWYELTLTTTGQLQMTGESEAGMVMGIIGQRVLGLPGCANTTGYIAPYFVLAACTPASVITTCYPAGTYYVFAAPSSFVDHPCTPPSGYAGVNYKFTVDLIDPGCFYEPACDCTADVNRDGIPNGLDVQKFTDCLLDPNNGAGLPPVMGCKCADVNLDGSVTMADIPAFVSWLLDHPGECYLEGDVCQDPFVITDLGVFTGSTCGFQNNYDEACPYTGSTSPDVVYAYTPAADMLVSISLCNSGYDTKVYVYEGVCMAGTAIACNDDFCSDPLGNPFRSSIPCVGFTGGTTYFIVVDGYGGGCGNYELSLSEYAPCTECPPNGVQEAEVCGTDTNGGCNMGSPAFEMMQCGVPVCGTVWANTSLKDTDWYQIDVPTWSIFDITLKGESGLMFGLIEQITPGVPGCGNTTGYLSPYAAPASCTETTLNVICTNPGTYYFFVATSSWFDLPCGPCGNNYTLTVNCTECPEPSGACCVIPDCFDNMYLEDCNALGGVWHREVACTPALCFGDTCFAPISVADSFSDTNNTCSYANDYTGTCLGPLYDTGPDVIYQWTVTADACYKLTLLTTGTYDYPGLAVADHCPPTAPCIAFGEYYGNRVVLNNVNLTAGTYYIMVDNWPSPPCINGYTLTAEICPPPIPGDTCADPILVTDAFTDVGTTMDRNNDYSGTCLQPYYDTGRDVVYAWTVTQDSCFNVTLQTAGTYDYPGMAIDTACPPGNPCLIYGENSGNLITFTNLNLAAGTYYIMLDNWPSPDYYDYTLTVTLCPTGACCVNGVCQETDQPAQCAALGGLWFEGQTCPEFVCPMPPANDLCENAQAIVPPYPVTVNGTTVAATPDCPALLNWNAVWYTIELPYGCNNLQVDLCPLTAGVSTAGIIVMPDCSCTSYTVASPYSWVICPSTGQQGISLTFSNLPGGIVYFPAYIIAGTNGMDFLLTVNVSECPTGACCVSGACAETDYQIQCVALGGIWTQGASCPSFVCPTGCQHSIVLTDPGYGDGWNGNTVSVLVNGVVVLNNVTLPSGYGPITYYFLADTGDAITTVYTGTAWPSENCYQLYDGANNLLCEQPPGCTYTPPGNCAVIGFCP